MMGYMAHRRVIHTRKELSFLMRGQRVDAKTDVCVMSKRAGYLFRGAGRHLSNVHPAQLIAGAVAAFYQTNRTRKSQGLPEMEGMLRPGITMTALRGQYPDTPTVVLKLVPPVADRHHYLAGWGEACGESSYCTAVL
ncbi:hypothetical protein F5I97DRAFT_224027 [Phlebopus sp. FC_14]|nr:hypothetical protein F5I97DRAFT_224027 [Phlebopus sp. FC_14]